MEIISASEDVRGTYAHEIPELIWATGPVSYEYHFADRALFDAIVLGSWHRDGTLFAADATSMAVEDGELMGIEIGMPGPEYRTRQDALGPVWQDLVAKDQLDPDDIPGVLARSERASWLNPVIYQDTYYIHALSVKPGFRGKRVGYHLIQNAITKAREQGFKKLQLDVLSDNPGGGLLSGRRPGTSGGNTGTGPGGVWCATRVADGDESVMSARLYRLSRAWSIYDSHWSKAMAKRFETQQQIDSFLKEPRLAMLIYHGSRPAPTGVPVWFDWNGQTVQMFAGRTSPKVNHLLNNPNVSVLVTNKVGEPEAWVAFDGKVVVADFDADEWSALLDRVAPRYWDLNEAAYAEEIEDWRAAPEAFVSLRLKPQEIRSGA